MLIFKDEKLTKCLVVFSHVLTLKHQVKQQHITWKWLFTLLQETNKQRKKQLFSGNTADRTKHSVSVSSFKTSMYCAF